MKTGTTGKNPFIECICKKRDFSVAMRRMRRRDE